MIKANEPPKCDWELEGGGRRIADALVGFLPLGPKAGLGKPGLDVDFVSKIRTRVWK